MTEAFPPYPPPQAPAPGPVPEVPWRRLDPRMLLVHPVLELVKFLPVLIGIFVLGSSGDGGWWQVIGIAIPVGVGVLRFVMTQFRITGTQIELQRGLIGRKVLTARLDRVRAVELTSTPIHRILGLAKVEVGTASGAKQDEDKFVLDSLPRRGGTPAARHAAAPRPTPPRPQRHTNGSPEAADSYDVPAEASASTRTWCCCGSTRAGSATPR